MRNFSHANRHYITGCQAYLRNRLSFIINLLVIPGHLCSVLWIQRQKPWQGSSILWHMHQLLRCCENIMHPKDEATRYSVNQIKPSSRLGGSNSITDNLLYGTIRLSIIEFSVSTITSIWLSKYELISSSSWFWQICFLCLDWLELKLTSVFCRY